MTTLTDTTVTDRIRLLAGVEAEEMSDADVLIFITMAKEWFGVQVGSAFAYSPPVDAYNNAVVYYACYLVSIAQNGLGVESMKLGDFFIEYDTKKGYIEFENKARSELMAQLGLSIKTGTYNADSSLGDVDWKKNIDGSDSTLTMKPTPANTRS
tara:strand:- start:448 stop:909 length:462 start_codon:yes stop_codon:yes gene_type:complete